MATNDVQADGHAIGREAAGNTRGGVTDHVNREGKGQVAPEGVHGPSSNGLWLLANRESRDRHGRREQQVISLHERAELGPELVHGQQGTGVISASKLTPLARAAVSS